MGLTEPIQRAPTRDLICLANRLKYGAALDSTERKTLEEQIRLLAALTYFEVGDDDAVKPIETNK